jgi:hypothetical protein
MKKHLGWMSTVLIVTIVFSAAYVFARNNIRTSVDRTRAMAVEGTTQQIDNSENQLLWLIVVGWAVALIPLAAAPVITKKRSQKKHHNTKKKA